ncbi:MAG: hypothetical protein U0525_03170 [Patescibacteria group bacterium]
MVEKNDEVLIPALEKTEENFLDKIPEWVLYVAIAVFGLAVLGGVFYFLINNVLTTKKQSKSNDQPIAIVETDNNLDNQTKKVSENDSEFTSEESASSGSILYLTTTKNGKNINQSEYEAAIGTDDANKLSNDIYSLNTSNGTKKILFNADNKSFATGFRFTQSSPDKSKMFLGYNVPDGNKILDIYDGKEMISTPTIDDYVLPSITSESSRENLCLWSPDSTKIVCKVEKSGVPNKEFAFVLIDLTKQSQKLLDDRYSVDVILHRSAIPFLIGFFDNNNVLIGQTTTEKQDVVSVFKLNIETGEKNLLTELVSRPISDCPASPIASYLGNDMVLICRAYQGETGLDYSLILRYLSGGKVQREIMRKNVERLTFEFLLSDNKRFLLYKEDGKVVKLNLQQFKKENLNLGDEMKMVAYVEDANSLAYYPERFTKSIDIQNNTYLYNTKTLTKKYLSGQYVGYIKF